MTSTLIRGLAWLFLEHGVKTLAGVASSILLINHLVPDEYGILSIALTTFSVIAALSSLGLDSILLKRFISGDGPSLFWSSVKLRIISALVLTGAIAIFAQFAAYQWIPLILLLLISPFFDALLGLRELAFAAQRYKSITLANSCASLTQLASITLLILFDAPLTWLALPFVLNRVVYIGWLYLSASRYEKIPGASADGEARKLLGEGLPLMIAAVAGLVYAAQDQWMIGWIVGVEAVGVYAAGVKIVVLMVVVPTIITNALYHKIIKLAGDSVINDYVRSLYSCLFYLGIAIYALVYISADRLVQYAFPEEYFEAASILKIYGLVLIVAFFQSLNNKLLILMGLQKVIMIRVIVSLLANFFLNLYLIPVYGISGAALATVISEILVLISYMFSHKTKEIFYLQLGSLNAFKILKLVGQTR